MLHRPPSYRHSHEAPEKGRAYERDFASRSWLRYVSKCERAILDEVLRVELRSEPVQLLDFACGTGRVLGYLAHRVERAVGVDVSESMLQVAREAAPRAEIKRADITKYAVSLGGPFNLITAFRFFPNAEPELRFAAMNALAEQLAPGGVLVFNNHQNAASLHFRLKFMFRRPRAVVAMSVLEMRELAREAGLTVTATHGIGILPAPKQRACLPFWMHRAADSLARRLKLAEAVSQNVVFVCQKPSAGPSRNSAEMVKQHMVTTG